MTIIPLTYFSHTSALDAALIHRSYCNEHPGLESNERLEFLGDSVLSVIISARLYRLLPQVAEGDLTGRRSYLVQTGSLASKAKLLSLDVQLKLSHGEEETGGRTNPSILANTFEAVLGALYLDSGISACENYLQAVFPDSELTADVSIKDPKSLLQEKSQSNGWGTPSYNIVEASGPDHAKNFVVSVTVGPNQGLKAAIGTGSSKQRAETEAAQAALTKFF